MGNPDSDGTNSATYAYLTNSPLVSQITFASNVATVMTTTKTYDYLNRLTSVSSANASSVVLDSHGYTYNSANQRTAATNVDNSTWNYQYDSLGQVTSGKKYWSDGTVVAASSLDTHSIPDDYRTVAVDQQKLIEDAKVVVATCNGAVVMH